MTTILPRPRQRYLHLSVRTECHGRRALPRMEGTLLEVKGSSFFFSSLICVLDVVIF